MNLDVPDVVDACGVPVIPETVSRCKQVEGGDYHCSTMVERSARRICGIKIMII